MKLMVLVVVALLLTAVTPAVSQQPVNISGVWVGTYGLGDSVNDGGTIRSEITQSGNTFSGTQAVTPNGLNLWRGTIQGNQIRSVATLPDGSEPTIVEGTVSGDEMAGTWRNDFGGHETGRFVFRRPDPRHSYLIVAGRQISNWTLGKTVGDLLKMNGPRKGIWSDPLGQWPAADYVSADFWEHHWDLLDNFYAITKGRFSQKVVMLVTEHAGYRTDKGIGPGVKRDALKAAYGKPTAVTVARPGRVSTVIYDQAGLGAWVYEHPRFRSVIAAIMVFKPGTARYIWNFEIAP